MATTEHFRNGGGTSFNFVFPILANSDLKVEIYNATTGVWDLKTENTSGQTDNDYTISNTNVVFNSATPSGTGNVHIYRNTNVDNPAAVYAAGSSIRAVDLNDNQTQVLYSTQESVGQLVRETDLKDSIVTSAKIADGTIVNADINTSAAIAGTKVTPSFGSQNLSTTGTAATGALTVTGAITLSGLVDTRDVAADGTKLDTIETNAKDDQTAAEIKTLLQSNKLTDSEITTGTLDNRYYTEYELNAGQLDNRYYTQTDAANTFYRKSGDTVTSTGSWISQDNYIATTKALDARIVDLIDDIGGFIPVTENTFPNNNPDLNNGPGTIVSLTISAYGSALTSTSNGSNTSCRTADGTGIVTLTGLPASTSFAIGSGILLETTTNQHIYAFHRLVPKATEVTTVAGISTEIGNINTNLTNVNAVGTDISNVNTVANNMGTISSVISNLGTFAAVDNISTEVATLAGQFNQITTLYQISSDITAVANDATDIGAVAGKATEIGRLGTADAVADLAILGTTDVVADMDTLATSANVTALNNCSGSIGNINTVNGSIGNVNTVATNITNVNTASTYLNNFLSLYLGTAASDPTQDALGNAVTEGDLYFNTGDKQLHVFNGTRFINIVDGAIDLTKSAKAAFNALYTASVGSNSINLGGLSVSGAHFANEDIATNLVSLATGSATYNLGGI